MGKVEGAEAVEKEAAGWAAAAWSEQKDPARNRAIVS